MPKTMDKKERLIDLIDSVLTVKDQMGCYEIMTHNGVKILMSTEPKKLSIQLSFGPSGFVTDISTLEQVGAEVDDMSAFCYLLDNHSTEYSNLGGLIKLSMELSDVQYGFLVELSQREVFKFTLGSNTEAIVLDQELSDNIDCETLREGLIVWVDKKSIQGTTEEELTDFTHKIYSDYEFSIWDMKEVKISFESKVNETRKPKIKNHGK